MVDYLVRYYLKYLRKQREKAGHVGGSMIQQPAQAGSGRRGRSQCFAQAALLESELKVFLMLTCQFIFDVIIATAYKVPS